MHTPPIEYLKAFVFNSVFFVIGFLIYVTLVPANGIQIAVLIGLSALFLYTRVRLIRIVSYRAAFTDRALFLTVLEDYLKLKDRWTLVHEDDDQRRYEAALWIGLYRFRAVLVIAIGAGEARLTGHERIVMGLRRELAHPHIATMSLVR
jgi:hypothetical protein